MGLQKHRNHCNIHGKRLSQKLETMKNTTNFGEKVTEKLLELLKR
jgi:hypothetical protein